MTDAIQSDQWHVADIRDSAVGALEAHARALDDEQAVIGLDGLAELAIHPILHDGFRQAGLGVHPEIRYPQNAGQRKRSAGVRCDIVLTRSPGQSIMDTGQVGTLFEGAGTPPSETYWLEVKVVAQFAITNGVARANGSYSSLLTGPVLNDLRKLAGDCSLTNCAALLVLFTETADIAEHDVSALAHRGIDKSVPVSMPRMRQFPIRNRIGNCVCTVALLPVQR